MYCLCTNYSLLMWKLNALMLEHYFFKSKKLTSQYPATSFDECYHRELLIPLQAQNAILDLSHKLQFLPDTASLVHS